MKKVMFFALMVMVSVMVFGTSVAEEQLKTDNMIASIPQERSATEQTSVETEGVLMAASDQCGWEDDVCFGYVKEVCCGTSPASPTSFCKDALLPSNCGKCINC